MSGKGTSTMHPNQNRRDRMLKESEHDPYHAKLKLKDSTLCTECASIYIKGRWTWDEKIDPSKERSLVVCPACQRIRDKVPAGFLTISNEYMKGRTNEVMSLIEHTETREKDAHPMKRIMDKSIEDDKLVISVSYPTLARNIGVALNNAYGGKLDYQYDQGEFLLRVKLTK